MLAWKKSLGVSDYDGIVSPAYAVFRLSDECIPRYFHYLFRTDLLASEFKKYSTGIIESRLRLYPDVFLSLKFPLPPKEEQKMIVRYLDEQTIKIESFIEAKERMMKLLNEEKLIIINNSITKGIQSKVKFKDSGIEWLKEIPAHWSIKKIKFVAEINKNVLSEKTDPHLEIRYMDISNASNGDGTNTLQQLRFGSAPSRARRLPERNDTIISTVRTYLRRVSFIENDYNNSLVASTGFAVLHPNSDLFPKYLYYLIICEPIIQKIVSESKGIAYPAINSSELKEIKIWYPSVTEQEQIVKYIESETSKIDKTLLKIESEIALLQEYKTALISEAVTGKIDVRGEV
jgi:type I restriction enzyme S subunit